MYGDEFYKKYPNIQLIKLTNETENHNNFQFKTGLNIDTVKFNFIDECSPGGIYFCETNKINLWLNYNTYPMVYARLVTIPNDSLISIKLNKFKADKIILSERVYIKDLYIMRTMYLQNKLSLYFVKNYKFFKSGIKIFNCSEINKIFKKICITNFSCSEINEICIDAIKNCIFVLKHVNNHAFTEIEINEIWFQAIKKCHFILKNVTIQQVIETEINEICLEIMKTIFMYYNI